jgi:serine protease Do
MQTPNNRVLGIIFLLSLVLAGVIGGVIVVTYPQWQPNLPPNLRRLFPEPSLVMETVNGTRVVTTEESAVTSVVDKAAPAVVSIVARTVDFDPFSGPVTDQRGIGTGFIIDKKGIVLTNSHVVEDTSIQYTVVTKDKKSIAVKDIQRDPVNDLAILTLETNEDLPTVPLGDSNSLKIGQSVVAIGNALGRFDNTVTVGVVSGIGRGITASGAFGTDPSTIDNVIQTDAALNPGNSGGPLLDLGGNVIGVNFATTAGAENIGFVIPINTAKPVIDGFRKEGRIIKPYLGVGYQIIDESIAQVRDLPQGAFVQTVVEDSPADKAGIQTGDIITKIAGEEITETNTLATVIGKHKVGDEVEVTVFRDGSERNLKVRLEEAPSNLR